MLLFTVSMHLAVYLRNFDLKWYEQELFVDNVHIEMQTSGLKLKYVPFNNFQVFHFLVDAN